MEITFRAISEWALLPVSEADGRREPTDDSDAPVTGFRWLHPSPPQERTASRRLFEATGWIIRSPLDMRVRPIETPEAQVPTDERATFERATDLTVDWKVGKDCLWTGVEPTLQVPSADYRHQWTTPFWPLGMGFFDWRLGFEAILPPEAYLFIAPVCENAALQVEYGILSSAALERLNAVCGLSIVVRPVRETKLERGCPIARIIALAPASLTARARIEAFQG